MSETVEFGDALPRLNVAQAALLLKKTTRTVRTYLGRESDPLPARLGGGRKPTEIPLEPFVEWMIRQRLAEVVHVESGEILDPQQERALLDRARRKLVELEQRKREGELVEVKDIKEGTSRMVLNARARLLAIPSRLGAIHGREAAGAVEALLFEAMADLAEGRQFA